MNAYEIMNAYEPSISTTFMNSLRASLFSQSAAPPAPPAQETESQPPPPPPPQESPRQSLEYKAALELELWKEKRMEAYEEMLKQKEAAHLQVIWQLGCMGLCFRFRFHPLYADTREAEVNRIMPVIF